MTLPTASSNESRSVRAAVRDAYEQSRQAVDGHIGAVDGRPETKAPLCAAIVELECVLDEMSTTFD